MPMILLLLLLLRLRHNRPLFLPLVRKLSPAVRSCSPPTYLPCSHEQDISFSVAFEKRAILDTSSAMMDTVNQFRK